MDIVDRETGQVLSPEEVEFAYTREGRHKVGKEYPNPEPLAPPIGWVPQKPIHEQIRDMVLREISAAAESEGMETAEEADDFEVGDDYDPSTPYEEYFEPVDPWPASRAVAELESKIAEKRAGSRITALRAELEALENGRPWPPEPPAAGGGGAQPPQPPAAGGGGGAAPKR